MIYITIFLIPLVITIVALSIDIFMAIWPCILDIIKSKNESRTDIWTRQIMAQSFVSQEKYSYLFIFHMNVAFCIGAIAMISTGTMLIGYFKYACGMFKIVRLEN